MDAANIKDIARMAGVGVSTVSRVINSHPDVNQKTRESVLRVIMENNYVPNNSARNLKRRKSKSVGVLIKGISNPFFGRMVQVIEKRLDDAGYTMIFQQVDSNLDEVDAALGLTKEKRLQGLVFMGGQFRQSREKLEQLNAPFVLVTITLLDPVDRNLFSSVTVDDVREARRAVDYLCALGHNKIAIITGAQTDRSIGLLRLTGYRDALEAYSIPLDDKLVRYTPTFTMRAGYEKTLELLGAGSHFTALFAVSDTLAVGACKALLERGLRIPRDVSVMGFDGQEIARYYHPSLATIRQPDEEMARQSIDILLGVIEQKRGHRHIVFEAQLEEGESCAPPPPG